MPINQQLCDKIESALQSNNGKEVYDIVMNMEQSDVETLTFDCFSRLDAFINNL